MSPDVFNLHKKAVEESKSAAAAAVHFKLTKIPCLHVDSKCHLLMNIKS